MNKTKEIKSGKYIYSYKSKQDCVSKLDTSKSLKPRQC